MDASEQLNQGYTRLRDFGAFRVDFSQLDTVEQIAVEASTPSAMTALIEQRVWQNNGLSGSLVSKQTSKTIIPFPKLPQNSSQVHQSQEFVLAQSITNINKVKRKKWFSLAFRITCTLLLFFFLFKSFSWSDLMKALVHVYHGRLLLGLVVGAFSIVISCYQWQSLLQSERIKFDLADLINFYLVGIAFNHFLPTGMGGDAVKAVYVANEAGNSAGSASAVVMSRVTGFFGMLLVALPVLVIWHNYFQLQVILWFLLLSLLVGGMIGGTVFFVTILPRFVKGKWVKNRIFKSVTEIGNALTIAMKRPRALSIAILFGLVFWLTGCLNYYGYASALDIHTPLYFYFVAIPFISLVTFLPVSINGFGLRESAFVFIFSTAHVPASTSLLLVLLVDVQAILFGCIGGYLYLVMGMKKEKKAQKRIA